MNKIQVMINKIYIVAENVGNINVGEPNEMTAVDYLLDQFRKVTNDIELAEIYLEDGATNSALRVLNDLTREKQ